MEGIRNLTIDHKDFGFPVVLAPMAGTTDFAFRQIIRELGCGLVFTEMVSAKALVYGDQKTVQIMEIAASQRPVGIQLFGADPQFMAQAAKIIANLYQPDLIDINMGCPVPKIVRNGEGSALMKDIPLASDIVAAMTEAVDIPISVKMRSGFSASVTNAPELAAAVVAAGAKLISVHGRTREQYYSGEADWQIIAEVKQAVAVPVIGNGDVFTPQDAQRMLDTTGCDGVMIGRGIQGNPWLCNDIIQFLKHKRVPLAPNLSERFALMRKQLDLTVGDKGEYRGVREMRNQLGWYVKGLPSSARFRSTLFRLPTYREVLMHINDYECECAHKLNEGE